ncbi:GIY-YIG nuclease family protein [Marinicrinis sediminis]|uniref:GIY-YIG nuclease family protein n=1 Tax=Marinicrinis sediminis TaxID=1652465 RepID=A0ABW5RDW7_9BACL
MSKLMGVYAIVCNENDKMIIGSASDIKKRWSNYKSLLKKDKYSNADLQADWDKYGEDAFAFTIVEQVSRKSDLYIVEQYWQDVYWDAGMLYNKNRVKCVKKKMRSGREAANHKAKMSEVQSGISNPRWNGKCQIEDIVRIKLLVEAGKSNKEIHELYKDKIEYAMISRIRIRDRYKSVEPEMYPYVTLDDIKLEV